MFDKRFIWILLAALIALPASSIPIFPVPTAGIYTSTIIPADVAVDAEGVPT